MKNIFFLILFSIPCLNGFAQSNIRVNNYWENTYYINPASISSEYQYLASGAARKQWMGFPGAPDTEFLTFAARLYTNKTQSNQIGQIGFKIFRDNIGFTDLINISPSYSYSIRRYDNTRVNLGFAYKIQNYRYDMSKSNLEIADDPATYISETKWTGHNVDVGIEYVGTSLVLGVASQNMVSIFKKENDLQTNTNFLYGMYKLEVDRLFNFLFGACAINNKDIFQGEFNVSGILTPNKLPEFQLGIFYRTEKEFGVLFGVDLIKNVRLACSYDYHIGGISHGTYGTPEIMLVWKIASIKKCDCEDLFK